MEYKIIFSKFYYLVPFTIQKSTANLQIMFFLKEKHPLKNSPPAILALCQQFISFSFDIYTFKTSKRKKKSEKFNSHISHCVVKSFVSYPVGLKVVRFFFAGLTVVSVPWFTSLIHAVLVLSVWWFFLQIEHPDKSLKLGNSRLNWSSLFP